MSWTAWKFETARFCVKLLVTEDYGYQYDGDDPEGETQAKLDSGEYVAFDSDVVVYVDGQCVANDSLCGSVYDANTVAEFWTAHRDSDPMNRNCSIYRDAMRAETGHESAICHYFPDMVRIAIGEARKHLCSVPKLRCA